MTPQATRRAVRATRVALCLGATILIGTGTAPAARQAAGTATATLKVHAHVVRSCMISATPVDFGDYDPLVANRTQPLDGTGSIDVRCTKGTKAAIELDYGQNRTGVDNFRYMSAGGTDRLQYQLFQDPGRARRWSRFIAAVHMAASTSSTAINSLPVYGRVSAGQNVTSGDYDDVVTATVTF